MNPFGAALGGAIAFAGIVVAIAGWRGLLPALTRPDAGRRPRDLVPRLGLGVLAFVVGLVATRWPVAAGYLAFGGASLPILLQSKRKRRAAVEKVEAIATWTESLRDIMATGAGLRETLRGSARVAPEPIRSEIRRLSFRLQHESIDAALSKLALDLSHPTADIVVASLLLATRWQAGGISDVLSSVARSARDAAAMKQRIEASRERTYTQCRIVAGTSITFILLLVVFRREFLTPYDSFGGQIAQAVIGGLFAFSGYAMYKLAQPQEAERVFGRVERIVRVAPAGIRQR